MNPLEALDIATAGFATALEAVDDDHLPGPTPCDEWDVRYLVAHVVGGNRFAARVLDGLSAEAALQEIMATRQLGDEPLVDFTSSADEQRQRFRADGALDRNVSHPLGELSGLRFLDLRVFDLALHTWDLARALGIPDELDADLARAALTIVDTSPAGMGFGLTPRGRVAPDATVQDRLLDLTGRDPAWSR